MKEGKKKKFQFHLGLFGFPPTLSYNTALLVGENKKKIDLCAWEITLKWKLQDHPGFCGER
jgi:hypothetical protein